MTSTLTTYTSSQNVEMDLCQLMHTLRLGGEWEQKSELPNLNPADVDMRAPAASQQQYPPDPYPSITQPKSDDARSHEPIGCAYLQAVQAQLAALETTSGEYLEAIFTHREMLYAWPGGHRGCASAFREIVSVVERRTWGPGRDADGEACQAFSREAEVVESVLGA